MSFRSVVGVQETAMAFTAVGASWDVARIGAINT